MRAIRARDFGGPEVLEVVEIPTPQARQGEVVVRVAAADVLYLDTQIRGGWGKLFGVEAPYVPGNGVAGEVVELGDGVDGKWLGTRVITTTAGSTPEGGYAEYAVARADGLVPVPEGLATERALALLHDGPTALTLSDSAAVRPGERVLITGAAGGLGILLVQLVAAAGGEVVAAARGEAKLALALEHGAKTAVDYSAEGWIDQVAAAGFDVVLDGVGGEIGRTAFGAVREGGRFSAHGAPSGSFAPIDQAKAEERGVRLQGIEQVQFAPEQIPPLAARALAEATAGRLVPVVGQTLPLAGAAEAHRRIEQRAVVGKTLLTV